MTLTVRVIHCRKEEAVSGGEEPELELREEQVDGVRILGQESRESHLEQTLELTYGKPPILRILRWQCSPRIVECRASGGRVSVKGELEVRMLYHSVSGEWEQMNFTVPAAAALEMEGADEDSLCDSRMEVLSLELEPGEDGPGRKPLCGAYRFGALHRAHPRRISGPNLYGLLFHPSSLYLPYPPTYAAAGGKTGAGTLPHAADHAFAGEYPAGIGSVE